MRYRFLILILGLACTKTEVMNIKKGECVLGRGMDVYQLIREDEGIYLFARVPVDESSPLEVVKDLSTFRKVECPH